MYKGFARTIQRVRQWIQRRTDLDSTPTEEEIQAHTAAIVPALSSSDLDKVNNHRRKIILREGVLARHNLIRGILRRRRGGG